jgi:signal transduction histidine kinase
VLARMFRRKPRSDLPRRHVIEDLIRSMALIVQPDDLRAALALRVRELVGCERVIFCGLHAEDLELVADFSTDRSDSLPRIRFGLQSPLCRWLLVNEEPLVLPHLTGAFHYLDESEQTALRAGDIRACVPLIAGDRLLGVLLIGAADQQWQLSAEDRMLLGRLARQVGLALENAELHYMERERLKNLHQSEQLAVAGLLAATVAHEVRNPLTAIRSTIQYVLDSATDWDAKRQLLEEILGAVDRIENIVGGILPLSRPQALAFDTVDLTEVCEQSLLLIRGFASAQGISLERQFCETILRVSGDARELNQVCTNLLLNACQAMPDGGVLTLRTAIVTDAPDSRLNAMIQVRDTGCGIPPEHMPRAFEPFFTTKRTGTGLGLSVCLEIATRHEGHLRLHSELGVGTVATLMIPLLVD